MTNPDYIMIERPVLEEARRSMVLLQMEAEGAAAKCYTGPAFSFGMPGWLLDTKASINDITEVLYPKTPPQDSVSNVERLRAAIGAGLRSFCSNEGDFTMSAAMRRSAADHILGQPDLFAALAVPINKIGGDAIKPPVNGETDPEWAKIRRAIDQFAGRVPSITKHRALHNTHLASVVARLDAAGDREAADTIVWQCWWRALDRERERFLLADAAEARS